MQTAGAAVLRRLDTEELPLPTKLLSGASRHAIVTARIAREWTQAQLNTQCSFPPNTIRDIESGKLCPTPTQLGVLNRVLKLALKYD
jgi:ribosome-binding protein aMBF1 (putative translation factor)